MAKVLTRVCAGLVIAAVSTALTGPSMTAAAAVITASTVRPAPNPGQAVKHAFLVKPTSDLTAKGETQWRSTDSTWPTAGNTVVTLKGVAPLRVGDGSIAVSAVAGPRPYAGRVRISVAPHGSTTAGSHPVVATLSPVDRLGGTVAVTLSYKGFAQATGGNYASRLRLAALPTCATNRPADRTCQTPTILPTTTDPAKQTLTATVDLTKAMTLTATTTSAGDAGPAGTYGATTLKPSGSWSAGGNSGSFTYAVPVSLPPAPGPTPPMSLSYDSARLDGQAASTQPQSSWVGDGWDTPRSFIEQTFTPCSLDPEGTASPVKSGDWCYGGKVLTLSLNGTSTSLVWDSAKKVWKAQEDSGLLIKHLQNQNNGTGTKFTDYWTVTDRSGTTYSFGMNHLPGWASGKAETKSVDSIPVYSAHAPTTDPATDPEANDPCYSTAGFASSSCVMAYRWSLDYVKDSSGNAASYYYAQSTNNYGKNNGATKASYIRDSYLDHIDYGFRDGGAFGVVGDRVKFNAAARCFTTGCSPLGSGTATSWPDVPFDMVCADAATTCPKFSPAMYSTVRLASIDVQQYSTATSAMATVDTLALTQSFPATGDGTSPTLWLSSVQRTGSDLAGGATASTTLPTTSFTSIELANRVDTAGGLPSLDRRRIATVTTETGAVIGVTYDRTAPCTAPVTLSPASNTRSCYPVYWTPDGYTVQTLDWFNRYAVTAVTQSDPTGGAPAQTTAYQYAGGPAWHYDDNEVVQAKYRTYGQFRGYATVSTLSGDGPDPRTRSTTTYYRGMSKNNSTTVLNLTDSQGGVHEDIDQLAGQPLESTNYLGDGGRIDSSTITSYWVSASTASRTRTGLRALTANTTEPILNWSRQAVTSGATTTWRTSATDTTYDAAASSPTFGLPQAVYSHTVPANPLYDQCTVTGYATPNTAANIIGLVSSTETDAVGCGGYTAGTGAGSVPGSTNTLTAPATVARPAQVVSANQTFYDDEAFAPTFPQVAAPTKGLVTMTRSAVSYASSFAFVVQGRSTHDAKGRVLAAYDANGNKTTTSYTDNATSGVTTAVKVTNPLSQAVTTMLDPARAQPLTVTDANNLVTTIRYDALGRTTAVWANNRSTTLAANQTFAYQVSKTTIPAVTTQTLNDSGGQVTSVTLYDALLRPRQTQASTPQGGSLVTDTFYDSRGWTSRVNHEWWNQSTTPTASLMSAVDLTAQVPNADVTTYDGLGRAVITDSQKNGATISTATTVYAGDRVTSIPPTGGTTSTTLTDSMGRIVELDQYKTAPTITKPTDTFKGSWTISGGSVAATRYGYDSNGNQSSLTDPVGAQWTTKFDLLARPISKVDPDAGTTSLLYDNNGNVTQSTDGRNAVISTAYDALNRKTGLYDAAYASRTPANQLAGWTYDGTGATLANAVGHLTSSSSYGAGAADATKTYTVASKGFNVFGSSLGETYTLPSAEGALAGTWTTTHLYSSTLGLLLRDTYPAIAGIPSESVTHTYTSLLNQPTGLGGLAGYTQSTSRDAYSRITQSRIGGTTTATQADITNTWDQHTGRLSDQLLTRYGATPQNVDEEAYTYDLAGNPTKQVSTRLGATSATETQCYSYDLLRRLKQAWTATDNCAATTVTSAVVGDALAGGSAYWTTWTFDDDGQRQQQIAHGLGGAADTSTGYTYGSGANGATQPHSLAGTAATTGSTVANTSYGYDASGNTSTRNTAVGNQQLTYDDAGRLAKVDNPTAGTTSYVYDADGNLLLQKDPATTTAYLGPHQVTLTNSTGALTGIRYYALPGGGTAYRTGANPSYGFQLGDSAGTNLLRLDATVQTPTWRQQTPYGAPRGSASSWIDNRTFLNKPTDPATGLTRVGARNYDPVLGRFITVDPVLPKNDPESLNGYAYADHNPMSFTDPDGRRSRCLDEGTCTETGNGNGGTQTSTSASDGFVGYSPNTLGSCAGNCASEGGSIDDHAPRPPAKETSSKKTGTSYSYVYRWDLGKLVDGASPVSAMRILQADTSWFPFPIDGCPTFETGEICTLHPTKVTSPVDLPFVGSQGRVSVQNGPTNITFEVVQDDFSPHYFDKPGSHITFSLSSDGRELFLAQDAEGEVTSSVIATTAPLAAHHTWSLQSNKARTALMRPSAGQLVDCPEWIEGC